MMRCLSKLPSGWFIKVFIIPITNLAILTVFVLVLIASLQISEASVERLGKTYEIVEKDALVEIEEKAARLDWMKITAGAKEKIINYTPPNLPDGFPDADRERVFEVDMTYTLSFDITDGKGNILYPKGYSFNPLDYIRYPGILVFLDGSKESHLKWFESSSYLKDPSVSVLLTKGSYYEVMKRFKRPVFYASKIITDRFQIERLPSVVKQKGKAMQVVEIPVNPVKEKKK